MMANIKSIKKEECCGCSACFAICGHQAISMQQDEQGFKYPFINESYCTECGLCLKVCPSLSIENLSCQSCYAVKHTVKDEQLTSTSGGFAAALSSEVIKHGGIVYGVAYENVSRVVTIRIDNADILYKLKGSKYVQTDPKETLKQVYADLKAGLKVVYFGTSCHVDGLKHFLNVKKCSQENLVTVDLVCHGVPSPKLFEEYISFLSKKKYVSTFDFRTKTIGWGDGSQRFCPTITYEDNTKEVNTPLAKAYTQLFFSNNCLRPHCYQCPYAGKGRTGDLTIADYWGLKEVHPDFFDKDGVSLILVNSVKGLDVFKSMNNIEYVKSDYKQACKKQTNLFRPSVKNPNYDVFWAEYKNKGFEYVLYKYAEVNFLNRLRKKILRSLKIPF